MNKPTAKHPFTNIAAIAEHSKYKGGTAILICGKQRSAIANGSLLALLMKQFPPISCNITSVRVFLAQQCKAWETPAILSSAYRTAYG